MALAPNRVNSIPQVGLSALGQALNEGSRDYMNISLQRQAEDRQRAQRLADLQDQRQFAVGQRDIERGLMLEDEARRRGQAVDDATLNILLKDGWLKPTDVRNPQAVQAAANARQAQLDTVRTRESALPEKFQKEADYLGEQDIELAGIESQLNAKLMEPEPAPPSAAEVRRAAIRMTNKPVPSDAEIEGMMAPAADAIMKDRFLRWSMAKEDAKNQIQLLRSQRTALRQSLTGLLNQGFVPNRPPPAPTQVLSAPASVGAPRAATAAEAAAAAGGMPPPAGGGLPAPTSDGYGGIMGAAGALLPDRSTVSAALTNPAGVGEIALRSAMSLPAQALNYVAGGSRRVAEGNAEREAAMAEAVRRFQQPSPGLPANPFFYGNVNQPGRPQNAMPPLPPLPSLEPAGANPAFTFPSAPGY